MKKISLLLAVTILFSAFTVQNLWKSDKAHSQLVFSVKHLGVSTVSGTFNDFDATIKADKADYSDAVIELTGKIASIDTRIEARDNHLKSADFFDAAQYPTFTFTSTAVKAKKKGNLEVLGNLTLHGITKPVTLTLKYNGTVENPMSKAQTIGFDAETTIKRSDFGIGGNFPELVISDAVTIKASGEFTK